MRINLDRDSHDDVTQIEWTSYSRHDDREPEWSALA
jgi:hypothetical protein